MTRRTLLAVLAALAAVAAGGAQAGPIDPVEALQLYYLDGFTFPAVEQDRSSFYASWYMDHAVTGNCATDSDGDGCPDNDDPCALHRDWACGTVRYDGHKGTDFANDSTPGLGMAAAEAGWVVQVRDGFGDDDIEGYGNYVAIRHAGADGLGWTGDDVVTFYGHMEAGTIRVHAGGGPEDAEFVYCGQRIGDVGSSGSSTAPHIHFEVRTGGDEVDPASSWQPALAVDPFGSDYASDCSCREVPGSSSSWWFDQGGYTPGQAGLVPGLRWDCRVAIVDDRDPGFSVQWFNPWHETWEPGGGGFFGHDAGGYGPGMAVPESGPGFWGGGPSAGGHWRSSSPADVDVFPSVARWTPSIPTTALYEVHVYVPESPDGVLSGYARYDLAFQGGHAVAVLDQAECEGRWCKLLFPFGDRFKMVTGSSGYVQLTNLSGEAPSTRIAADAARFVKVDYPGDSDLPSGWAGAPCGSSNDCWGSLVCSEGGACASSCWTVGCAAPTVCEIATGLCIEPGAAMTPEDYLGDAPDGDDLFDDDDEDGGVEPGDGLDAGSFDPRSGDCGCSSGSDAPGWLGVLVVLGLAGRRRPRRRHVPA